MFFFSKKINDFIQEKHNFSDEQMKKVTTDYLEMTLTTIFKESIDYFSEKQDKKNLMKVISFLSRPPDLDIEGIKKDLQDILEFTNEFPDLADIIQKRLVDLNQRTIIIFTKNLQKEDIKRLAEIYVQELNKIKEINRKFAELDNEDKDSEIPPEI